MSAVEFWLAATAAAAVGLLLAEVADLGAWIAPKIVRHAAARMPTPEQHERYLEEWLAELSVLDGLKLIKLAKAISLWIHSWNLAKVLRRDVNTVGIHVYLNLLALYSFQAIRKAWAAQDPPRGISAMPLVFFSGDIILGPTRGKVNASVGEEVMFADGRIEFKITLTCNADVTKPVSHIIRYSYLIVVFVYDLYLLRRRESFRKIVSGHRMAMRALATFRRSDGNSSSSPVS